MVLTWSDRGADGRAGNLKTSRVAFQSQAPTGAHCHCLRGQDTSPTLPPMYIVVWMRVWVVEWFLDVKALWMSIVGGKPLYKMRPFSISVSVQKGFKNWTQVLYLCDKTTGTNRLLCHWSHICRAPFTVERFKKGHNIQPTFTFSLKTL